ncbi:bacillithiol biosynthesis deacetylase BshB1 [Candidatus Sumerlaeota bacterium]|nr:bacillithiol biosynthesis deacetylase BshB1 [Candidatus Sumerlaeota bacterium]
MLDALFIGAHPDDCELFAGGLIALLTRQGYTVGILDLTEGELSSRETREERHQERQHSAELLGLHKCLTLSLGDTSLQETDENIRQVVTALRQLRPKFVFLQYPDDRHPDHVKAAILAKRAIFYARLKNYPVDEEPFLIPAYAYYIGNTPVPPQPTFIVDITETYQTKLKALHAYTSQFHNPGFKGFPTYISSEQFFAFIETRARYYGHLIGVEYGEPYILDRPIKLTEPLSLLREQKFL